MILLFHIGYMLLHPVKQICTCILFCPRPLNCFENVNRIWCWNVNSEVCFIFQYHKRNTLTLIYLKVLKRKGFIHILYETVENLFCHSLFQVCSTCKRIITADSPGLSHGEFHWHACPHCFSCHCCGKNLINQQFLLKDGRLFCSTNCRHVYDTSPKNAFPRETSHCHW